MSATFREIDGKQIRWTDKRGAAAITNAQRVAHKSERDQALSYPLNDGETV